MRNDSYQLRADVLCSLGASPAACAELLTYNTPSFTVPKAGSLSYPMDDEAFVPVWREYAALARTNGFAALSEVFAQLTFPIQEGISSTPEYIDVVQNGLARKVANKVSPLESPEAVRIDIYRGLAGAIPVITTSNRSDFASLVRIFGRRNEPVPIPASMGATFVSGYNNWDRLRRSIGPTSPANNEDGFPAFNDPKREPMLFKDRFIILSSSTPYSGVDAGSLHLPENKWLHLSFLIRREHEYTHYFTKRVMHSCRNRIHDELLADYAGLKAAIGQFRADWFLRFLGLEGYPQYRTGGRMENYRGNPRLTDGAFAVLQRLTIEAALNVERFDRESVKGSAGTSVLMTLASYSLEQMASPCGFQLLASTYARESEAAACSSRSRADMALL